MRKGEVWMYYDKDSRKRRPCVVVGNMLAAIESDVTIAKITSTLKTRNKYDVTLEYWKEHGLIKPSIVRCSKLFTVHERDLLYKVAKIEGDELEKIKRTIAEYIME